MHKYIGCSGYYFDDWKEKFYPAGIPKTKWLSYYAQNFNTVEINNTFYKTPSEKTFTKWYNETPPDFLFTLKANKYITHTKKLKNVNPFVQNFYDAISPLQEKAGFILWQLPGNIHKNIEKIESFCKTLSNEYENAIEFRHFSWFDEDIYNILSKYNVTLVIVSAPGNLPAVDIKTTDTVYLRFHGKDNWYRSRYSQKDLEAWSKKANDLHPETLLAYFNNDYNAYSVENCSIFKDLTG